MPRMSLRSLRIPPIGAILLASLLTGSALQGSLTIPTAYVGDVGNVAHQPTGYGSVNYGYYITRYEVTFGDYATFLNAVATQTDPYGLYNPTGFIVEGIERSGDTGAYTYAAKAGLEDVPVYGVTFWNAARFANWLSTGGTETGVYLLNGNPTPNNASITRDATAWAAGGIALASEDEWFKAAFYDPTLNNDEGGYWKYPFKSNTINAGDAVFDNITNGPRSNAVYSDKTSHYGTFHQAGNLDELSDTIGTVNASQPGDGRLLKGGSWATPNVPEQIYRLEASFRGPATLPTQQSRTIGFRLTSLQPISHAGSDTTAPDLNNLSVTVLSGPADGSTTSTPGTISLSITGIEDPQSGVASVTALWGTETQRTAPAVVSFDAETETLNVQIDPPAQGAYGIYSLTIEALNGAGLSTLATLVYSFSYADPATIPSIVFTLIFPDDSTYDFNYTETASMTIGTLVTEMLKLSLTYPVAWHVYRPSGETTGAVLFSSTDTNNPTLASTLGITTNEQLYLIDASVGFYLEDARSTPSSRTGPHSFAQTAPVSEIITHLETLLYGGSALPAGWQLYRIDDQGTAEPSDDFEEILLSAEDSPTVQIGFLGINPNETLYFDVRTPFNGFTVDLSVPNAQGGLNVWMLQVPQAATVAEFLSEFRARAQTEGLTLPPAYEIGYPNGTGGYTTLADSDDLTDTTPLNELLPNPGANGLIELDFIPLLRVMIPHDTVFNIGFDSQNFNYTLNGELAPTLRLHRNKAYTFLNTGAASHPFTIATTPPSSGTPNQISTGISNGSQPLSSAGAAFTFTPDGGSPSTLYYRCTLHEAMGGTLLISDPTPLEIRVPYDPDSTVATLLSTDIPAAAATVGLSLGSQWELWRPGAGQFDPFIQIIASANTLAGDGITPFTQLSLLQQGDGGSTGGGDTGGTGPSVSISLDGQTPVDVAFSDTDSVADFLNAVQATLGVDSHWALLDDEGSVVVGTHLDGSPSSLASLGITDGAHFSLLDTTIAITIEDRRSPGGGTFTGNVSFVGSLEQIKVFLINAVFGPVGPQAWKLDVLLDDNGTTDPSDDSLISLMDANTSQTELTIPIDSLNLAQNVILVLTEPTSSENPVIRVQFPNLTYAQELSDLGTLNLTITGTQTIGSLIYALEDAIFGAVQASPPAYRLLYIDPSQANVPVADSTMDQSTAPLTGLPAEVLDGTAALVFEPMLEVRLPYLPMFFNVAFDANQNAFLIDGRANPTLIMQRGSFYSFSNMDYSGQGQGQGYNGPDFVISSAAPGTALTTENSLSQPLGTLLNFISFQPEVALNGPLYYRSPSDIHLGGTILLVDAIPSELLLPYDPAQTTTDFLAAIATTIQALGLQQVLPSLYTVEFGGDVSTPSVPITAGSQTLQELGIYPTSDWTRQIELRADQNGGGNTELLEILFAATDDLLMIDSSNLTTVGELRLAVENAAGLAQPVITLPSTWQLAIPSFDAYGEAITGISLLEDNAVLLADLTIEGQMILFDMTPFTLSVGLPNGGTVTITQVHTLLTVGSIRQTILSAAPGQGYSAITENFALYLGATEMADPAQPLAFYGIFSDASLQVDPADPYANATAVATDDQASNATLLQDGNLYFIKVTETGTTLPITDMGRPADRLLYNTGPWPSGNGGYMWETQTAIAVEWIASEQQYRLVIRGASTTRNGPNLSDTILNEQTYWSILGIDSSGAIRWENSEWLQSIVDFENTFGQDLNNEDGDNDPTTGIGLNLDSLAEITYINTEGTVVAYDTDSVRTKVDAENNVYIYDEAANPVNRLITNGGNAAQLQFSYTWPGGANAAVVVGLRKQETEGYELIRKFTDQWTDPTGATINSTGWELVTISALGVVQNYQWRQSVADLEVRFGQDFDLDGSIGFSIDALTLLATAGNGAELREDATGFLYIVIQGTPYTVSDNNGSPLQLQYSNSYFGGSNSQSAFGFVYDSETDEYVLVLKIEDTFSSTGNQPESGGPGNGPGTLNEESQSTPSRVSYVVHFLGISGTSAIPDWNRQLWTESLSVLEIRYNADLDGDGATGVSTANLLPVSTDTFGFRLLKSSDNRLFIAEIDTTSEPVSYTNPLPIVDQWGGAPEFDFSFSSEGFSEVTEAIAVEAVYDPASPTTIVAYRLAIRRVVTIADKQGTDEAGTNGFTNWEIQYVDSTGKLIWDQASFGSITSWEEVFGQDLDGDNVTGFNSAALVGVTTDPADSQVVYPMLDRNGAIFVHDPQSGLFIPVIDSWGGSPVFNQNNSWADGASSSSVYAVEILADNTYLLVVRRDNSWSIPGGQPVTNTHYEGFVMTLSEGKLVLSWDNMAWYQTLSAMETAYNVDLDGDGVAGINFSALTFAVVETDGGGEILVRADDGNSDTADPLFIREGSADAYTYVAIVDAFGGAPTFSGSWGNASDGGGTGTEAAYAVEKLDGGGYRLAVLNTFTRSFGEGETATTEVYLDWILFTLDDSVSGKAVLSWENATWTQNIASAENDFGQDLNGDGVIGTNYTVQNLQYVSTDSRVDAGSAGYASNAHLMLLPNDKSLFIEYPQGTLVSITDLNGYAVQFHRSGKWNEADGTKSEFRSEPRAVEAVFELDGTTLKHFLLAIRNQNTFGGQTRVDWEIHTVSPSGILDWNLAAWSSSVIGMEETFNQDLNEDGGIGLTGISLPAVDTDKSGLDAANGNADFLFRDAFNALYILPNGSTTYLPIKDAFGGIPTFDWSNSWGNNVSSSAAIAVESQADGTFLLAVKRVETFGNEPTRINWELFPISSAGVLQWENAQWIQSIDRQEPLFRQDLNGDGVMGFNVASLNLVDVGQPDTTGVVLQRADNGDLYVKVDASTLLPVLDEYGNPMRFNYAFSDENASFTETPFAVRKVTSANGTTYQLVVRFQNSFGGNTTTDWQLFTLSDTGLFSWAGSIWSRSIAKYEADFGWDINGDGTVGTNASLNTAINTDTVNQRLERNPEGGLVIVDGGSRIDVVDDGGNSVQIEYTSTWDGGTSTKVAFAVARQDNGSPSNLSDDFYLLALKIADTYADGSSQTYWETFKLSLSGVIDWTSGSWSSGIAKSETAFDQDLNGDGVKGIRQAALTTSPFDTTGAKLKRDAENGLYIDDPSVAGGLFAIVDPNGGMPLFDFTDSWAGGSFAAVSHAVEKQADGTYRLIVKFTETTLGNGGNNTLTTNWELFTISSTGVLDWAATKRNSSVKPYEALFNQDLDGDGAIGQTTTSLSAIQTDTTGARLRKNAEDQLFIRLQDESTITIVDPFGFQPTFNEAFMLPGGTLVTKEPFAVQGFVFTDPDTNATSTRYKLVIRETVTSPDGSVDYNYEGYTVLGDGTILWDSFLRTETAKPWESVLNQDINGNGEIEVVGSARNLTDVTTDTTGATLQIDEDNILYIRNGANRITIKDNSGGTPTFTFSETFANGSYNQAAFAVALQNNGTAADASDDFYLLAVRQVDTIGGVTEIFWKIFRVSLSGILDWNSIEYKLNTELNETRFNQDMNGDGTISNGVTSNNGALSNLVQTGSTDPAVLATFGNRAQSELITITGKDGSNKITFFSEGDLNGAASSYGIELGVVQTVTGGVESKMAGDSGLDADIAALTDLLNFTIEITDPNKHGKIHKMTFALPPGATNVTYFKLNVKTGQYFAFDYDPVTGEGARIESSDPTRNLADVLAVYIRDNGKYDEDARLGFIKDPGALSETGISAWRTNNALSDNEADADGDGVVNIIEYLVDSDPNTASTLRINATVADVASSDHLMLQILSARASEPVGVSVALEGSEDLLTFAVVPHTHSVSSNGDGTYTHTYMQNAPVGDAAYKRFIRLKVTEAP